MITKNKVTWAVKIFEPYNSARQKYLRKSYGANMPDVWKEVNVAPIPKSGKSSSITSKYSRTINLTSFLLRILEILTDLYLKEKTKIVE